MSTDPIMTVEEARKIVAHWEKPPARFLDSAVYRAAKALVELHDRIDQLLPSLPQCVQPPENYDVTGWFMTRLDCPECQTVTYVEGDVKGETHDCEGCGAQLHVQTVM